MNAETYCCAYWDHLRLGTALPVPKDYGLHPQMAEILRDQCDGEFKRHFPPADLGNLLSSTKPSPGDCRSEGENKNNGSGELFPV
jgi:hypothetical protein